LPSIFQMGWTGISKIKDLLKRQYPYCLPYMMYLLHANN